jgi:hypothetical protein
MGPSLLGYFPSPTPTSSRRTGKCSTVCRPTISAAARARLGMEAIPSFDAGTIAR